MYDNFIVKVTFKIRGTRKLENGVLLITDGFAIKCVQKWEFRPPTFDQRFSDFDQKYPKWDTR